MTQIVGLFLILGLGACMFANIVYRNADWLVMSRIDDFLDLNAKQSDLIEPKVKDAVAYLKAERFPELIGLLDKLKMQLQEKKPIEPTVNEIDALTAKVKVDLMDRLLPTAVELFTTLEAEQLAHLQESLEERNEETVKFVEAKPETYQELLQDERDDRIDSYEDWLGSVDQAMVDLILPLSRDQSYYKARLDYRRRMQAMFVRNITDYKSDKKAMSQFLRQWVKDPVSLGTEDDRIYVRKRRELWRGNMSKIVESLSDSQRKHLVTEVSELIQKMRQLG